MISYYKVKEEKKPAEKSYENEKKVSLWKTIKSKVEALEEAVFIKGVKHAAQSTKMLEEIVK